MAVVTGASSGIARATALRFARRGASVVVAARSKESLDDVLRECEAVGAEALAVPTDVANEAAVQELARRAAERFGRIDVWVNAAAVIVYGEFEKTPSEAYRRVIETNLFGQIHGARAALPYFRERGKGVLVNIASVWGSVSSPYVSAYVVSKHGVRAFSESLQEALWLERKTRDIHVCTILPQCVDTPIFRHAGNYTPRTPKTVPPVIDPERVVQAVLRSVEHPRRQRTVGVFALFLELAHAVTPSLYSHLVPKVMNLAAFSSEEAEPGPGNVFEPMPQWNKVDGEWRRGDLRALAAVGAAAVAAGATAAWWRRARY